MAPLLFILFSLPKMVSTGGAGKESSFNSSRTSSSPSSHSPPNPRLMEEEVWRDISLASLQENSTPKYPVSFQDFFSPQGLARNPVPPSGEAARRYPSLSPATILGLNPGTDRYIRGTVPMVLRPKPVWNVPSSSSMNTGFHAFATGSSSPGFGNERLPGSYMDSDDRRRKRQIKNRESAARSRARKYAYENELELKIAHLAKENAKLKKRELLAAAAAAEARAKKSRRRASSAPI